MIVKLSVSPLWQEAIKKSPTFIIRNVIFGMSSVPSLSLSLDGCRLFGPDLEWDMDKQERIQSDCDGEGGLISSCKNKQTNKKTAWDFMLSEISQTQKDKNCMIPLKGGT